MKQRELARLHVLSNVLEYQAPISQAAEILGVADAKPDGSLVLTAGTEQQPCLMDTGDAILTTPSWIPRLPQWCDWPAPSTREPTTRT